MEFELTKMSDRQLENLEGQVAAEKRNRENAAAAEMELSQAVVAMRTAAERLQTITGKRVGETIAAALPDEVTQHVTVASVEGPTQWKEPSTPADVYQAGDLVKFKGDRYRSLVDHNSFSPEESPSSWKLI